MEHGEVDAFFDKANDAKNETNHVESLHGTGSIKVLG
jgi:hypothetical protein